jgi:hypothetical protein
MHDDFFGNVAVDDEGIPTSERTFVFAGFGASGDGQAMPVVFMRREAPLAVDAEALARYARTLRRFLDRMPEHLAVVVERAFAYYRSTYADVYENPAIAGAPALGLTTPKKHFAMLRVLQAVVVGDPEAVTLRFRYEVDTEHDLEVLFVDGTFVDIGGALDTVPPRSRV